MALPTPRVFPKCPKCEGTKFESQKKTFTKVVTLIIYCESCGAVLGVVNHNEKK